MSQRRTNTSPATKLTAAPASSDPAAPPVDEAVQRSLAYCHQVTRKRARNFYYGLKLMPEPKRSAGYAIYAFMRECDDLADGATHADAPANVQERLNQIERFRRMMQGVLDGGPLPESPPQRSVWPAFRHVMRAYPIDPNHLHAMLDGQCCDLTRSRYQTFDELYDYCYKVASVVGLVCISIWGYNQPPDDEDLQIRKLAEYRGIALQLTNILRDVVEDARRDRIYLPQEDLDRFGCSEEDLLHGRGSAAFDRLMVFQIERARSYYQMSAPLERHLDPTCRPTSWALMRIYQGLLDRIARDPRSVLNRRVRLSSFTKAGIALRALWKRRQG